MVIEAVGGGTHDLRRAIAAAEQAEAVDVAGTGLRESAPQWRDENCRRVALRAHSSCRILAARSQYRMSSRWVGRRCRTGDVIA